MGLVLGLAIIADGLLSIIAHLSFAVLDVAKAKTYYNRYT